MSIEERDQQCIRRLQARDEQALAELYDRHASLLFAVVLRILRRRTEAEDVLQEAWLQAWRNAPSYDPKRGPVAAWLLMIARSRALDRYRSIASRQRAELREQAEVHELFCPDASGASLHRELHERIHAALGTLQPQQRRVLEIAYFEGLSQSEIAAHLEVPLGTVKSWTRKGLLLLREILAPYETGTTALQNALPGLDVRGILAA